MRLDFRNIGKGLEAVAGAKKARDLAQESARYDVTPGAYGTGLQENITQLQGLREQDPTQAPAYDQAIAELQRRSEMTAPDYSVASGPTNFATRQEARQAAAPLRAEGLAGVYRRYGDVAQADALEARAQEMQRGLMQEKRAQTAEERAAAAETRRVAREPLEIKQLENALVSQGLSIADAQRVAAEQKSILDAREKLQTLRKDGPLTAAAISSVAGEFKLDPTKFLQAEDAVNTLEIKDLKRNLSSAALKGEDGLNKFLADKFDPDKTDNIKPMITKARDGSFVVTYGDRVLPEYGSHKNMMSLVGGVINLIDNNPFETLKTLSTLETQAAQRLESEAGTRLRNAQAGAVGLEKLSPLEKNLNTLKRLNIPVTDAQIKTMVLGAQKDPALEAELAAITKIAGSDTANPKVLEALPGQIQAALARSKGRETATVIVNDLIKAQEDGKGAEAIAALRKRNMPEPALKAAAEAAGVPYIAPVQPTAAATPAARPAGLVSRPTSQQKYGLLTPMATIEADARAGNPDAIAYLDYLRGRERVRNENARAAIENQ